jgi:hypothetical protein
MRELLNIGLNMAKKQEFEESVAVNTGRKMTEQAVLAGHTERKIGATLPVDLQVG